MAKTILITGASSGIGCAVALALAREDAAFALHYHHGAETVAELRQALSEQGCASFGLAYDLTRPEEAKAMVEEAIGKLGRLDVLVNVVGPFFQGAINEITPTQWQEAIALNLHTCFNTSHYAQPHLCAARGQIVNFAFAGVENLKAWTLSPAYCAAKAGVVVLTKSWAAVLAAQGVRVNALCPGLVEEGEATEAERQRMAEQVPLGRPVRPEEVAATVRWLVEDSPKSLTGSLIAVSGGWEY
jgi:NAD(P)-dependent dehydrogenase (short-subunit alcohol dehydrogenase family)